MTILMHGDVRTKRRKKMKREQMIEYIVDSPVWGWHITSEQTNGDNEYLDRMDDDREYDRSTEEG